MEPETTKLLTTNEFADRLNVSRTTVFKWIKDGTLMPGRHFIRIGRIVRFLWEPDLIREIHEDSEDSFLQVGTLEQQASRFAETKMRAGDRSAINLNY
jgi:excisionase family DNA binding protein